MQFFPKAHTLVLKHLHKAVETPIIVHHAITHAPLVALFGGLFLMVLLHDHLPLGEIANDNSSFSQFASDEMRSFMQTVAVFVAFAFRHPLVHLGEMDVPTGLLLTAVSFGAKLVQLLVVPTVALEPADVVKAALVSDAHGQGLNAQIEGDRAVL